MTDLPSPPAQRCSASNATVALPGTAPTTPRWWLIEHPGPWGSHAVRTASPSWIADAAEVSPDVARVLLIRPHTRSRDHTGERSSQRSDGRRVFTFTPGQTEVWSTSVEWDEAPVIDSYECVPTDHSWTPTNDHPQAVVCTNGKRDLCCAEKGRLVLNALSEDVHDLVWEGTHLGGHRFAPVALAVPSGAVLGRVTPQCLAELVSEGSVDLAHLRGRSDLSPAEQVGEWAARKHWRLRSLSTHLTVTSKAIAGQHDRMCVSITAPGGEQHRVDVYAETRDLQSVSCGQPPTPTMVWRVGT